MLSSALDLPARLESQVWAATILDASVVDRAEPPDLEAIRATCTIGAVPVVLTRDELPSCARTWLPAATALLLLKPSTATELATALLAALLGT